MGPLAESDCNTLLMGSKFCNVFSEWSSTERLLRTFSDLLLVLVLVLVLVAAGGAVVDVASVVFLMSVALSDVDLELSVLHMAALETDPADLLLSSAHSASK